MTAQASNSSPKLSARIAGLLYMIVVAASVFALSSTSSLIVRDDVAATAENILASEQLFRVAFTANLISAVAYTGVVAILYEVMKPAGRTLSVVAAFLGLAGCAMSAIGMVNYLGPLIFLGDAAYLGAFSAEQLQALARVSLRLQGVGNNISLVFFGFYCVSIGCLIFRSTFLPRILGLVMLVAGLGWLTSNLASFVVPPLGSALTRYLLPVSGLCETLFTLWLLVMGVNAAKWKEQLARAS